MSGAPEQNLVEKIVFPAAVWVKRDTAQCKLDAKQTKFMLFLRRTVSADAVALFGTNPRR